MKKTLYFLIAISFCIVAHAKAQSEKAYSARIALSGGWTTRTNTSPRAYPAFYKDYLETVKQGWSVGANAQFNINDWLNIGAFFDYFNKRNATTLYAESESGDIAIIPIDNTYVINFIGASLGLQQTTEKSRYSINYLIGFVNYSEKGNYSPYVSYEIGGLSNSHYLVGHHFGQGAMATYDYFLNKNTAIGVQVAYLISHLDELNDQHESNTTVIPLNEPIYLNRLNASINLAYYF